MTTMPSANPEVLPSFARRIARLTPGVGVYRSAASTNTVFDGTYRHLHRAAKEKARKD